MSAYTTEENYFGPMESLLYFTFKGSLSWAFLRQVPPFKHAGLQVAESIHTSVRKNNVNIESFIQIDKI